LKTVQALHAGVMSDLMEVVEGNGILVGVCVPAACGMVFAEKGGW
jgi:hypothetical protein